MLIVEHNMSPPVVAVLLVQPGPAARPARVGLTLSGRSSEAEEEVLITEQHVPAGRHTHAPADIYL